MTGKYNSSQFEIRSANSSLFRNNYAAARLQELEQDLNLTPSEYQAGLSILYVGYLLAQVPSNMLLNYFGRPSWYIGFFACAWGLVTLLTALVTNFAGIMAWRLILGVVGKWAIAIKGFSTNKDLRRGTAVSWYLVLPLSKPPDRLLFKTRS